MVSCRNNPYNLSHLEIRSLPLLPRNCGLGFQLLEDVLRPLERRLYVLADIVLANQLFELGLVQQLRRLLARSARDQRPPVACIALATSSMANSPVASSAVILRRRRITTGGSLCMFSVTTEFLSVGPEQDGPWMRKMVA